MFELSHCTFKVCCVPSALAQVIVAGPVTTACPAGLQNTDVPNTKKNTAYLLAFFLTK